MCLEITALVIGFEVFNTYMSKSFNMIFFT